MPDPVVPDDPTLVQRCRAGDGAAWEALVKRYQRLVYAVARRAGLDEQLAADVFQTVFQRLVQHLPRIAEPAGLQAWVVTTAKREAWLQRQRSHRMVSMTVAEPDGAEAPDDETGAIADSALGPEETVAHWQQLAQVQRGLERLDERCRQLLRALFGSESVGYEDVAERLGMPVGSIGPTRARCLAKLRRLVD
jgi:RNA polymerase sigma factor (sigma-70 family)